MLTLWCVLFFRSSVLTHRDATTSNDTKGHRVQRNAITLGIPQSHTQVKLPDLIAPSARLKTNDAQRVDCSESLRFCTSDADCSIMCQTYETVNFHCDAQTHICQPLNTNIRVPKSPGDDGDDDGDDDETTDRSGKSACNVKAGEYAMLMGYTNLGAALWQCMQLYK